MRRGHPEALASRKVVQRKLCTEGSGTAKSGTDEQERHMRHSYPGKQPRPCKARRMQKGNYVDAAEIGGRKMLLPGETRSGFGFGFGSVCEQTCQGVSRGHSSYGNEPVKITGGLTKVAKD